MNKLIKNVYILRRIFKYINEYTAYNLVKYNKKLQKDLEISFKDYQILYNKIVIEIIMNNNLEYNNKDKNYFVSSMFWDDDIDIYFDNVLQEHKRHYITKDDNVSKIKLILKDSTFLKELFYRCKNIREIKFLKFNRKDVSNMNSMFNGCSSLINLDLSNFKTDNVIDMSHIFYDCSSLTNLDLSKFKTDNVIL